MDRRTTRDPRRRPRSGRALGVAVSPPASGPPSAPAERGTAPLDEALVGRLQAVRDYPCASVLMTTAPAPRMTARDAARLDRFVRTVGRRMVHEAPHHAVEPVIARLHRLTDDVRASRTGRGIALYASDEHDAAVVLPIPVADRVVVDPTFATRDLVRSLARHPRVRIVVASERSVRVLEGWSGQLGEVRIPGLDAAPARRARGDRGRAFGRDLDRVRQARLGVQLRRAAETVAGRHRRDPLPLVLAGVGRQVAAWKGVPAIADALIGTIPGNHDDTPVARLDGLSRAAVDQHLRSERREALAQLVAAHPERCAFGVDAVWTAAGAGGVELLCVEDGFTYPARPARVGAGLELATRIDHSAVLDDAVDEIIEMVHRAGGRVVIVRDGALTNGDGIAALLRPGPFSSSVAPPPAAAPLRFGG